MKKKSAYSFIKAHNLINRIYDMFNYLNLIHINTRDIVLNELKNSLHDIYYIETLAKYFEDVKNKNKKNIELNCNLKDLINDLNYLKQYLTL